MSKYNDIVWDYILENVENGALDSKSETLTKDFKALLKAKHKELSADEKYMGDEYMSSFIWEFNNVKKKPLRTMEWVNGEHAMLYDWFECTECGTLVETKDSEEECLYILALCPVCNKIKSYPWKAIRSDEEDPKKLKFNSLWLKRSTAFSELFEITYHKLKGWTTPDFRGKKKGRASYVYNIIKYWIKMKIADLKVDIHTHLFYREVLKK